MKVKFSFCVEKDQISYATCNIIPLIRSDESESSPLCLEKD
jgi:hypothetical protein